MATRQIDIAGRASMLAQRISSELRRCGELQLEVDKLSAKPVFPDDKNRCIVVVDLIDEARNNLVECQLAAHQVNSPDDSSVAYLANHERRVSSATDLLNRAQLILDFEMDIWGKRLPTDGLHGK